MLDLSGHVRGRPLKRAHAGLPLAVLTLLLASGCGGGHPDADATAAPVVVTPAAPYPCTAATGLSLPAGWPGQVPLPAGLVVTRTEHRSGDRLIAYGRAPGDFHAVVDFFNARLPTAGFTQKNGEIDPHDAESDFTGTRFSGRWTTGSSADCPTASEVSVLVTATGGDVGADPDKTAKPDSS